MVRAEGAGAWVEYAGGYSDMQAQRKANENAASNVPDEKQGLKSEKSDKAITRTGIDQTATKLTYRDKYALEKLPQEIDALRTEIATFQKQLDDPTLYARDPEQFANWAEKLSQARDRLEKAEEKWLALEIRREEIENGA